MLIWLDMFIWLDMLVWPDMLINMNWIEINWIITTLPMEYFENHVGQLATLP